MAKSNPYIKAWKMLGELGIIGMGGQAGLRKAAKRRMRAQKSVEPHYRMSEDHEKLVREFLEFVDR